MTAVRALWRKQAHLLGAPVAGEAVDFLEGYADRPAGEPDLATTRAALAVIARKVEPDRPRDAEALRGLGDCLGLLGRAEELAREAIRACQGLAGWVGRWAVAQEARNQRELLLDVFGSPFRPPRVEAAWLAWNGGTVAKLARVIYRERRFADLPILADALEEAGCEDTTILSHCRGGAERGPAEHVRGCWVVDALLGYGERPA